MSAASYVQTAFNGGEWSQAMQGRIDHPAYRISLNVCLNAIPMEQGAWARRPGFRHAAVTRGGAPARVVAFDFKQAAPYTMEFTSGYVRFFSGPALVKTNDAKTIWSISAANPAVVTTTTAHGWATGDTVLLSGMGESTPMLQNRQFKITVTGALTFSLADAMTGESINGASLGPFGGGAVARVYEIATPYVGTMWASLRRVQCDVPVANGTTPGAVLLHQNVKPYVIQVTAAPTANSYATFSLAAASFKDGPYLDPFTNGVQANPSTTSGLITLTLSFPTWSSATAYAIGAFVTYSGVNYESLQDQNVNHTPNVSPSYWQAVSAGKAIGPNGFQGSDIGRHIRLFSEPAEWSAAATYAQDGVVAYNPSGFPGQTTYWSSKAGSNTGNKPGADLKWWTLMAGGTTLPALWSWGRIAGFSNQISGSLAGSANIGDLASGGGLAAAFDGVLSQIASASAEAATAGGPASVAYTLSLGGYVGKNYSAASAQAIQQVTLWPSSDRGLAFGDWTDAVATPLAVSVTVNLRAKATAPASAADGTLLGTITTTAVNAPIIIASSDQTTTWNYVWVEISATETVPAGARSSTLAIAVAECVFFNPPGSGTSSGITVELLGPALLYTAPIRTWRLGLYSDTTGWPTCGTYHEGRLWLSGVIANRIDGSKSNDIFNFAPTNPDGQVAGNNAIAYTFNAPDINPILWMEPDYHGIVCGTQAGEWLVQATSQNLPLTPTTIQAHRVTANQCANIEPRRTDLTLAVVQSYKREIIEYFADVYSGKFTAGDLTERAKHLTKSYVQEIAYQPETTSTLWARCGDGTLIGCTYKRRSLVSSQPPDVCGWHRLTLGSGRTIESLAAAATADGLLPTIAVVTTDDSGVRHVEFLTKMVEETDDLAAAWLLDDAVTPTSITQSAATASAPYGGLTINGLWHLNGETVDVSAAGLDCGRIGDNSTTVQRFTVANGAIFVPYGDGVSSGSGDGRFTADYVLSIPTSQIVVGFTYTSDGQIVRPALPVESGARNGPAFGKTRRTQRYAVQVAKTAGLSIGTEFATLHPVLFKDAAGAALAQPNTFTGVYRAELDDDYSLDSMLCWRITRPLPALIAAVSGMIHTQDL